MRNSEPIGLIRKSYSFRRYPTDIAAGVGACGGVRLFLAAIATGSGGLGVLGAGLMRHACNWLAGISRW